MKQLINKFVLFALLFCGSALAAAAQEENFRKNPPEPGPAPEIELGTYEQFELDNGLKVIVVENHRIPRVSYQLFVDVPLLKEGDKAGMVSLAGQLLRAGTENRTKAEIDEAIDFIGATLNTNSKGGYGAALTKHQDALLEIMSDVLLHPSFPEDELDKLKKQTMSGLAAQKEDPSAIASNVSQVLRYGKSHPYGELTKEETVERVSVDDTRNYYETYFKPNISYLIVVGDIAPMEAKTMAQKYFGDWQQGEVEASDFEQPHRPDGTQVGFVDRTGSVQSVVNITYPIELKPGAPEVIVGNVLNGILGSSSTARLFVNLREDKGYTYGAYSSLQYDPHVGYFNAGADVRNEVTDSAITQFLYEMDRIGEEPVSDKEMEVAKAKLAGSFARSLESPQTVARFALNTARYDLSPEYYADYLKNLDGVSKEQVMEMAQQYITPDKAHIIVVGDKDEVAESLKQFDSDGEITYYDTYGNELMPAEAAPVDLTAEEVIDNYIEAIGSKAALEEVKDLQVKMNATVQGMQMEMMQKLKTPDKYLMNVSVNGMVMQQQKYDGEEGVMIVQGQEQKLEGEQLEGMAMQANPFPELKYDEMGVEMELKGLEEVNGSKAYKVALTMPNGNKSTVFFDADTGYKVREVRTADGPQGSVTVTTDLSDYQEVEGIKFPYTMTISGMMPMPLKLEVASIEVNKGLADEEFEVE